jgi:hypothetical protein
MSAPQPVPDREELIKQAANVLAEEQNVDVFFYNSEIARPYDEEIIALCDSRNRRDDAVLILCTEGGDPDAAYRIARCFQNYYRKFTCIVAGYCKSAGTLVTVGAHELVMGAAGELGPLDIQMSKRDELGESQSGLIVTTALQALAEKSFSAFEHFFLTIKKKGRRSISFKMSTEIACKLTSGLFSNIYSQVDPMHMGETYRATAIAQHYGLRLDAYGGNLQRGALDDLISQYPSHSFVIDGSEAAGLFKTVREPNEAEANLIALLGDDAIAPLTRASSKRKFVCDERVETQNVTTTEIEGNPPAGAAGGQTPPTTGGDVEGLRLRRSASSAS